jgi:carbon-monoxide dehydrogenase large subunit
VFRVAGVPGVGVTLADLASAASDRKLRLESHTEFVAPSQTFPYGAHGAVVEVDLDTGDVEVIRVVAVDDCGTVLDPMIAEGQVQGSLVQGLGQAMLERIAFSEEGTLTTSTLMDYPVPAAADVPSWELHHTRTPAPSNPLGAKGIGESGTIGLPPAIVNAVLDALEPFEVDALDMPITPARVWDAIRLGGRA